MQEPPASRPHMPGYGTLGPEEGTGLLPWSWAVERLSRSRNYWLATVRSDGRPHVMPVWAVWDQNCLWFSSSLRSRKIHNLQADPRCTLTTEDAAAPVVMEGTAEIVTDPDVLARLLAVENAKYSTDYTIDLLDPAVNATVRVRPRWAFGLDSADFSGSPTRWVFEEEG
jgi:PPOX class probable F420-dependent enzyme